MPANRKTIPIIINAVVFIAMEIAALHMLTNNDKLQNILISEKVHGFMAKAWGGSESVRRYFSLAKENENLAQENFVLSQKLRRYQAADETTNVRNAYTSISKMIGYEYTPASIVKISRNKQHNYIIIGKGSNQGILPKSGIISRNGVVGIVDAVDKEYSYALSFMNNEISISARLGKEGAVGPLVWDGKSTDGALLKEIPLQCKFHPGDTIYTSGYSSIFPADIPLGVTGESRIVNGATNEIKIKLFQDFSTLRYVTVVTNVGAKEMEYLEKKEEPATTKK